MGTLAHHFGQPHKGAATDKEDIAGVQGHKLLLGMFAPGVGWHIDGRAFDDFQQRLLHTFAAHVPRDAGVVAAFAGNFVDLVDVDNPVGSPLCVPIRGLQQTDQNALHIFAHIASLGQAGGVGDGEGHIQHLGQHLGQECLAAASGTDEQHIAFGKLYLIDHFFLVGDRFLCECAAAKDALVVVVDSHRQGFLGLVLADDVLVQEVDNLSGAGYFDRFTGFARGSNAAADALFRQNLRTQTDAFVADENIIRAGNQPFDFGFVFAAKGTGVHGFGILGTINLSGWAVIGEQLSVISSAHTRPLITDNR